MLIHGHAVRGRCGSADAPTSARYIFRKSNRERVDLAELLCHRIRQVECVRFVNTETEAVLFAVKAARAFTGRSKIAKLEGRIMALTTGLR